MTDTTANNNPDLRTLFHKPVVRPIGGTNFVIYKLAFDQFDDALAASEAFVNQEFTFDVLKNALRKGSRARDPLLRTIAGCLKLEGDTEFLAMGDLVQMPVAMLGEAVLEIMEVNADFFIQTLPSLLKTAGSLGSIGSKLPSYLLDQVTSAIALPATASAKSGDSSTPLENTKPSASSAPL
jgi:hypothetical protein